MLQDYINLRLPVAQLATEVYADDFANELSRWPTDYLEHVQLSQWRGPELNIKVN